MLAEHTDRTSIYARMCVCACEANGAHSNQQHPDWKIKTNCSSTCGEASVCVWWALSSVRGRWKNVAIKWSKQCFALVRSRNGYDAEAERMAMFYVVYACLFSRSPFVPVRQFLWRWYARCAGLNKSEPTACGRICTAQYIVCRMLCFVIFTNDAWSPTSSWYTHAFVRWLAGWHHYERYGFQPAAISNNGREKMNGLVGRRFSVLF